MVYQEQPVILFLAFSSTEAEIYFQVNVYLGLKRNTEVVGQDRKNVVGKIKCCHPISSQEAKKKSMEGWTQMSPPTCPSDCWWHIFTDLMMAIN